MVWHRDFLKRITPRHVIGDGTPHHIKRANKRFITIYLRRISGEQTAYSVTADGAHTHKSHTHTS